jgi:thiamine-phosphate pyrophosphorylase
VTPEQRDSARKRLAGLHVLADDDPRWKHDPVEQARAACAGGAAVVQLRAKGAIDREALAWCRAIRPITRNAGALFIVNDRFDLALAAEADGVHLGQDDLPPDRIPPETRELLLIGRSTHDPAQAQRARQEPIDYLAFGPVFGTTSKQSEYDARGLAALGEIAALAGSLPIAGPLPIARPPPLVAIGGIGLDRVREVIRAGAAGAAVISAVAAAEDRVAATRALVSAIEEATP